MPTVKELYSLMDFSGIDPSGKESVSSDMKPFINTRFFDFAYGDPKTGSASDYPTGHGPQGDAIRVDNHVRLVRDAR